VTSNGSANDASKRWSATGNELRRSSVTSLESLIWVAKPRIVPLQRRIAIERNTLLRTRNSRRQQTVASAAKPHNAAKMPTMRPR